MTRIPDPAAVCLTVGRWERGAGPTLPAGPTFRRTSHIGYLSPLPAVTDCCCPSPAVQPRSRRHRRPNNRHRRRQLPQGRPTPPSQRLHLLRAVPTAATAPTTASNPATPASWRPSVCFEVNAGEAVALLGDTGAGKATLVKPIPGVHAPDDGSIQFGGIEVRFRVGITLTRVRTAVFALCSSLAALDRLLAVCRTGAAGTLTGGGMLLARGDRGRGYRRNESVRWSTSQVYC